MEKIERAAQKSGAARGEAMKEKLYLALITTLIAYAVPRIIDLLSQLSLALIQQLFL